MASAFPISIRAAVARGPKQPFSIENLSLAQPKHDEVLVRIVSTGICHTDIATRDGLLPSPHPIVLGHEGTGVVEAVGSQVSKVSVGDHVIMSYSSCGTCRNCSHGKPSYCASHRAINFAGQRLDGTTTHRKAEEVIYGSYFQQSSFATHALAGERNVLRVSKDLPLATLAPLGCGVQTGAGAVLNTLKVSAGSTFAVFGCGAVGLSAIMAAKVAGATNIVAVDLHPSRLTLAKELGAHHSVVGNSSNLMEQLKELTSGGLDFSLDTTGNPKILKIAFESLRTLGVCALVGGSPPGSQVSLDMLSVLLGRTLRGIIQGDSVSQTFLPQLIDLYRQGRFPFDRLVTFYDSLNDINRAVEDSESGKVIKPVIRVSNP
eukprot:GILK01004906.1.p1 GENE.GILK01004906.1~~GILK01004906.1.p1  ORF type:complete len:402 (+),score=34.05 GILK01004906.1:83-1207(+)